MSNRDLKALAERVRGPRPSNGNLELIRELNQQTRDLAQRCDVNAEITQRLELRLDRIERRHTEQTADLNAARERAHQLEAQVTDEMLRADRSAAVAADLGKRLKALHQRCIDFAGIAINALGRGYFDADQVKVLQRQAYPLLSGPLGSFDAALADSIRTVMETTREPPAHPYELSGNDIDFICDTLELEHIAGELTDQDSFDKAWGLVRALRPHGENASRAHEETP